MDTVWWILVIVFIIVIGLFIASRLGLLYISTILGGYGYNPDFPKEVNVVILSKLPIKDLEQQRRVSKEVKALFDDNTWRPVMKIWWLREHGFAGPKEDIDPIHYDIELELEGLPVPEGTVGLVIKNPVGKVIRLHSYHLRHYQLHSNLFATGVLFRDPSAYTPIEYIMSHPTPGIVVRSAEHKWNMDGIGRNPTVTLDFMLAHPTVYGMKWTRTWAYNPNITLYDIKKLGGKLHDANFDPEPTIALNKSIQNASMKEILDNGDIITVDNIIRTTWILESSGVTDEDILQNHTINGLRYDMDSVDEVRPHLADKLRAIYG